VRELSLGERMKMELIAALLHSPEVLFLDEPTIGLDVVAQHNVQVFLKEYQRERKVTILLTSHYMKDIAALCQRVVVIAGGQIIYDGSLSGIIDRFSGHKVVTLTFGEEDVPGDLNRYGHLIERDGPKVKLQVDRQDVGRALAAILAKHTLDDVSVEDPPLEQVIADVFSTVHDKKNQTDEAAMATTK
jgi:ABC-2 type transport system ATP-binding protein